MGQCTSSKSCQIATINKRPKSSSKKTKEEKKMEKGKSGSASRGEATLFGFKRPAPQVKEPPPQPSLPSVNNGAVTQETIEPLVIPSLQPRQGTPKLTRAKKNPPPKAQTNRFGFRPSVQLSNKVADVQQKETKAENDFKEPPTRPNSIHALKLSSSESRLKKSNDSLNSDHGKFTSHFSHLPRPQCPVRVSSASHVDKWAKTAANTQTLTRTQFSASSGACVAGKSLDATSPLEIKQLEESPSMNKLRSIHRSRPLDIVMKTNKTFDVHDRTRGRSMPDSLQPSQSSESRPRPPLTRECTLVRGRREMFEAEMARENNRASSSRGFSSDEESVEIGGDETSNEEKQHRDIRTREKDPLESEGGESPVDELWGHGEAMAMDDGLCANFADIDKSPDAINLRSVLLTIEDPTFATLAAMSSTAMLEDEVSPETIDLSCSPPSVEPLPPPPKLNKEESPDSPGSPTNASNSLSSDARERDFLIDDEIADQPGLVFNDTKTNQDLTLLRERALDSPKSIANLAGQVSRVLANLSAKEGDMGSTNSVGTLSPCESIASDDLMVDYDPSETSNFEDLNEMDETALKSELQNQSGLVIKEWNSILNSHPGLVNGKPPTRLKSRLGSSGSAGQESPRSASNLSSPMRNTRLDRSSPGDDLSDDSGIRVDRGAYQDMIQDVINVKSMLLKLRKALQESETINPFNKELKNGLYLGLASSEAGEGSPQQLADLRRQVVLLQQQLLEKDRIIGGLQEELKKTHDSRPLFQSSLVQTANAATQTDRIRPLSIGSGSIHSDSSCSLVSNSNESLNHSLGSKAGKSHLPVGSFRRSLSLSTRPELESKLPKPTPRIK